MAVKTYIFLKTNFTLEFDYYMFNIRIEKR